VFFRKPDTAANYSLPWQDFTIPWLDEQARLTDCASNDFALLECEVFTKCDGPLPTIPSPFLAAAIATLMTCVALLTRHLADRPDSARIADAGPLRDPRGGSMLPHWSQQNTIPGS
jgi:hypothetical protein